MGSTADGFAAVVAVAVSRALNASKRAPLLTNDGPAPNSNC